MELLIPVILPIQKTEAYLGRCLDSILSNTHKNLEIICEGAYGVEWKHMEMDLSFEMPECRGAELTTMLTVSAVLFAEC